MITEKDIMLYFRYDRVYFYSIDLKRWIEIRNRRNKSNKYANRKRKGYQVAK